MKTTCFRLRTLPLGFDSAAPWKIVDDVPEQKSAPPVAASATHFNAVQEAPHAISERLPSAAEGASYASSTT